MLLPKFQIHFLNLVKVCFSAFEHCIIILINLYCQQHVTLNCFMFVLVYLKSNQIFTSFQAETAGQPYLNLMIIGFSAFSEGCLIIRSIFKMQLMYSSHSKRGLVCVLCIIHIQLWKTTKCSSFCEKLQNNPPKKLK